MPPPVCLSCRGQLGVGAYAVVYECVNKVSDRLTQHRSRQACSQGVGVQWLIVALVVCLIAGDGEPWRRQGIRPQQALTHLGARDQAGGEWAMLGGDGMG